MKYAVGEINNEKISVEYVTEDPTGYVSRFEPIDIVNGEQYAWNEEGERFIFLTGTDFDDSEPSEDKMLSVVDTGKWTDQGPRLKFDRQDDVEAVKSAVAAYCNADYSSRMSSIALADLMEAAIAEQ